MSKNLQELEPESRAAVDFTVGSNESLNSAVSERRRRFARFAFGAPVLLTLASRPVLAGQCLSNMMSGNLSDPNRGNCAKGWSPGGWGQPGGQVHTYSTVAAWTAVGLVYGNYQPNCGYPNKYECYLGGATLANVPSVLNKDGVPTNSLLRAVLTVEPSAHQLTRHLVCAYLNASLSELSGSTFHYILTKQQVVDLASGVIGLPPGYATLQSFLASTWN